MGRFLLATWPFLGCVYPFLSLANALTERGHDVAIWSGERARPILDGQNVDFFPFRTMPEDQVWATVIKAESGARAMWRRPALAYHTFRDWLAGTVEQQVADLSDIAAAWRPDVIVTEPSMWGANLVLRESLGLPVALFSSLIGCLIPGPDAPPWGPGLPPPRTPVSRAMCRAVTRAVELAGRPLRRRMNRLRAQHGLAPLEANLNAYLGRASLYLIPSARELDYDRHDVPGNVCYVGPCMWAGQSAAERGGWLDALPADRPWVHVTEGSLHYQDPFVLRTAIQGLAGRPYEVILTTGQHRDPELLGLASNAPNVHITGWLNHRELLPRCDVLVTTGGAGSVMAALLAELPMVVVPTHWDKPDNAQRLVEAAVAIRVNPGQCTPTRLRAAVERVLADGAFKANARRMARILNGYPGPSGAAALLESLLTKGAAGEAPVREGALVGAARA